MPRQFVSAIAPLGKALRRPKNNLEVALLDTNAHVERTAGAFATVAAMAIRRRAEGLAAGESNISAETASGDGSGHMHSTMQ
jgi:hypothetical protein